MYAKTLSTSQVPRVYNILLHVFVMQGSRQSYVYNIIIIILKAHNNIVYPQYPELYMYKLYCLCILYTAAL